MVRWVFSKLYMQRVRQRFISNYSEYMDHLLRSLVRVLMLNQALAQQIVRGPFSKRKQVRASRNASGPFLLRWIDFVIKKCPVGPVLVSGGASLLTKLFLGLVLRGPYFT